MKIDGYEITYNSELHKEEYFAVIGKKRILMPDAFKEMYTDDYREIELVRMDLPEIFGMDEHEFYIPRRTAHD